MHPFAQTRRKKDTPASVDTSSTSTAQHSHNALPTPTAQRSYVIWKHLRKSLPRTQANDNLIHKFFQATEIPPDVKVFTDAAGPWPSTAGERAFLVKNHPGLTQAIDYCVANGAHLISPSLGDYSWYGTMHPNLNTASVL